MAQGYIKVIVTTNFDRLVESALEDAGIVPSVLSTPEAIDGALPLIHTRSCVIKLHGDYLDTRIRNTPAELAAYDQVFDQLLDRIFDEFGLIVCGWSAEWDEALRKAIRRVPSRRFTTYWAVRGDLGDEAKRLVDHRRARVIPIDDADEFFQSIQQFVESIGQFSMPHPLSTEAAVASLKRYISEPRYRIHLSDLVGSTIERVVNSISDKAFAMQGEPPTTEKVTARVRSYEASCSTLLAMALVGGFWADQDHRHVWRRALRRLGSTTLRNGYDVWLGLQRYPAILLLYSLGLGAIANGRLRFLGSLLATRIQEHGEERKIAAQTLPPSCLFGDGGGTMRILEGMKQRHVPLNDWIHDALRRNAKRIIPDRSPYTLIFDELEILMALSYAHHNNMSSYLPIGAFGYRHDNRRRILAKIERSLVKLNGESPL